jgi:hypothetical protein
MCYDSSGEITFMRMKCLKSIVEMVQELTRQLHIDVKKTI